MMQRLIIDNPAALWLLPAAILGLLLLRRGTSLSPAGRPIVSALRMSAILSLVLILAHPALLRREQKQTPFTVTVLRDVSDSLQDDGPRRDTLLDDLLASVRNVPVEVMDFAGGVVPRGRPMDGSRTNLQAALELTFAQTAKAPASHVIVLSDGRENQGNAAQAARWFAARGGKVHAIGVGTPTPVPPRITQVQPSIQNEIGRPVRFVALIDAPTQRSVDAVLLDANDREVDRKALQVSGQRAIVLSATPSEPGLQSHRLELRSSDGSLLHATLAAAHVGGPPSVLVVDPFIDELDTFLQAIAPLKLDVQTCTPDRLPEHLGRYAAIVLSDLSGSEFPPRELDRLRASVEAGNGLIFIGGSNCIPSRLEKSPLAAMLPFSLAPPKTGPKPKRQLTVCYVLDRSGSMGETMDSAVTKLDLVKASIHASIRDLPEETRVVVIVFDGDADMVVPPTPVTQREKIDPIVDRIVLGGGTDMPSGVEMALNVLAQEPGERYMVVLTDGVTASPLGGWDRLTQRAAALNINWTSIAVGVNSDQALLRRLAGILRGQYFYCGTASRVPKVFITQARSIRDQDKPVREPFTPSPGPDFALLSRIDDVPGLTDAMDTESRRGAQVMLHGRGQMPLLASWRVGLGQVIAFSSSAKPDWAGAWSRWKDNGVFWTQLLQRCLRPPAELFASVQVFEHSGQVIVALDVTNDASRPVTGMRCEVQMNSAPGAPTHSLRTPRPGLYEIALVPTPEAQVVNLLLDGGESGQVRYALTLQEKPIDESRVRGADVAALRGIAQLGNGIYSDSPATVAAACQPPPPSIHETRFSLVPILAGVAIALWLADMATRKWTSI